LKKGGTTAAAGSIIFALIFNVLLFVAAPLLLTNALFIAAGLGAYAFGDFNNRAGDSSGSPGRITKRSKRERR